MKYNIDGIVSIPHSLFYSKTDIFLAAIDRYYHSIQFVKNLFIMQYVKIKHMKFVKVL